MKKLLLAFLVLSITGTWAQEDIYGRWQTDKIPGLDDQKRFLLTESKTSFANTLGNIFEFQQNGKFTAAYRAPCGNDCFPSVSGRFERQGLNYMRLHVDSINIYGLTCKTENRYPNKDMGLYFMHKTEQGIKLLPATGDLKTDRIVASNIDLLDKFYDLEGNMNIYPSKKVSATDDLGIVSELLEPDTNFRLENVKILYAENVRRTWFRVILFEHNEKRHLVIVRPETKKAGLYTGTFLLN